MAIQLASASATNAQSRCFASQVIAGGDLERYVRALDLSVAAKASQWTIRPLASSLVDSIAPSAGPWADRCVLPSRAELSVVAPSVELVDNTSYPYGFNDGPVWAGRGLTAVLSGGVEAHYGHFAFQLAPVAFYAQNAAFSIADNGRTGNLRFGDLLRPDAIDLPQRFGDTHYSRLDPGESELRIDAYGLAAGVSTRSQVWGPAHDHPLILGNNAGGIPRVFAGTSRPFRLRWLTVHGQIIWGVANESGYGPDTGMTMRHFETALVGTIGTPAAPGLELGGARYFHVPWPGPGGHLPWGRIFQAFLGGAGIGENTENQLASIFLRLAPPGKGFEVYGEFGREDRGADLRDVLLELDHDSGYLIGFARSWFNPSAKRMTVVRAELLDTRISHLQQQRSETPWYMHVGQYEGHTERGQVLGSVGAYGGGASVVSVERYSPAGRTSYRWDRIIRATPRNRAGLPVDDQADVLHAFGVERMRFVGRGELSVSATVMKDFNRYFSRDAGNLKLGVSYRLTH